MFYIYFKHLHTFKTTQHVKTALLRSESLLCEHQ